MIVNRIVWGIKKGKVLEAAELLRAENIAEKERGGYGGPVRLYIRESEPDDLITIEYEYTDLEECKSDWDAWLSRSSTPAYMDEWHALRNGIETNEIWTVVD